MSNLILTTDNYYTKEADMSYMSCSQYESFMDCEAKAMAKLQGRFKEEPSQAFLVGNYFHTYLESPEAHQAFLQANFDQIFKTKTVKGETVITGKFAPFVKADEMLAVAESDPAIKKFIDMPGENEKIMTGNLFGVPWRIRIDKYIPETRLIIDWKTVANIWELQWNNEAWAKVSFVENFKYLFRAAAYMEVEKQNTGAKHDPMFILVCISKQDPPDKEIISLNNRQRSDMELEKISENIIHIQRLKHGEIKPKRCGYCEYCRATKKIKGVIEYFKLEPGNRDPREDDYAIPEQIPG